MAKKNNEIGNGGEFKDYLAYNGNAEGLEYIAAQEKAGHKLTVKGGGFIAFISLDCIYGYNVFADNANKKLYIDIITNSSAFGSAAAVLAYCVLDNSVHMLIKGDTPEAVSAFLKIVNGQFEKEYDGGKNSVGYPFRTTMKCRRVQTAGAIWDAMYTIYGYSPDTVENYPYNSFAYIMSGNAFADMVLGVELKIINPSVFSEKLLDGIRYSAYRSPENSPEKVEEVINDLRARYLFEYGRVKENAIAFVIGETAARTGTPYLKIAKKMKCAKNRHDLVVTTVCDFMIRRRVNFDAATTLLGLGNENRNNLVIEALAEINRLTGYSYEYIAANMLGIDDGGHELIADTFAHLHEDRGNNFAELCERFHVTKDIMAIRAQCRF
jgi:REP element-mobilizing transposase RayT